MLREVKTDETVIDEALSWRDTSLEFFEIGRSVAIIEEAIRRVRGTASYNDKNAASAVSEAYYEAKKLVRNLDVLRRAVW